ncbi:Switch-associated protein 70 [Microtus ochrogaster]|uniref:Switch-associated protein 70 n=1 Tax=Microtus ochrogaster TaxID=79684 RepID=A0A8J6L371_MICOH|nr:Switch-associated protein 70 [Microtus ochrogaster]
MWLGLETLPVSLPLLGLLRFRYSHPWPHASPFELAVGRQVLSHNLCTVLKVPHDPVALEEHFRDDDEGPVSNQGYMPYLNKFILEKVQDNFDKIEFNRMCWTLCVKKNLTKNPLLITEEDAFKVWVIFNFLSEDKYPLLIVPEEIEYLLKKLTEAMGGGWQQEQFEHYKINFDDSKDGLSAWELIELVGNGQFSKGMDRQTVSMAINEVFNELILDVLKQGYMMKKGHKRKNWTERWFVLKPNIISYYVSEDLKDKKGDILLDENCCVESLPDKDGKKCLFLIKCFDKTFEISASDKKKKQEWIQAIHSTVHLLKLGSPPPHKEARQRRKELRRKLLAEQEELERQMKELQAANENKQQELESVRKKLEEAASRAADEEKKRLQTQAELQTRFSTELEREKLIRQQMEEQVAQKSSELEQYLQRVRELEDMYLKLQEALEDERQARQDEETVRKLQARLLEEESSKRAELEKWHLAQQQAIQTTEAEKQELEQQRVLKEQALQEAMAQLEQLELERKQALEQYEVAGLTYACAWLFRNSWGVDTSSSEDDATVTDSAVPSKDSYNVSGSIMTPVESVFLDWAFESCRGIGEDTGHRHRVLGDQRFDAVLSALAQAHCCFSHQNPVHSFLACH